MFHSYVKVDVKMSVQYMSFSAHADAKGIMQLISYCEPRHIMLVHGEAAKMDFLKGKIQKEFGRCIEYESYCKLNLLRIHNSTY